MAQDALAFDRASVRTIDEDGHLKIAWTRISKANVCPYFGREIPEASALGLQPDKIYQLYRDPDELAKGAATFNGKPVLIIHKMAVADDHPHEKVVGSLGNDTAFQAPYLMSSMTIWDGVGVGAIESEAQREISASYRYDAAMTPGEIDGVKFDGRMTNIRGNHVALVERGRAGSDVFAADQRLPFLTMETKPMAKVILSRKAALAKGALAVYLKPKLAADAAIDFGPVLKGVTAKNFKTEKSALAARLKTATEGKLAADADLSDVIQFLDALEDVDAGPDDPDAKMVMPVAKADPDSTDDESPVDVEALKTFAKGKMSDEDYAAFCKMLDGDTTAPLPAAAADKPAGITKGAMDAAIATATAKAAEDAESKTVARLMAAREAENEVTPVVGKLAAMDTAEGYYRAALDCLGVAHDGANLPGLKIAFAAHQQASTAKPVPRIGAAMDSAAKADFDKRFPNAKLYSKGA